MICPPKILTCKADVKPPLRVKDELIRCWWSKEKGRGQRSMWSRTLWRNSLQIWNQTWSLFFGVEFELSLLKGRGHRDQVASRAHEHDISQHVYKHAVSWNRNFVRTRGSNSGSHQSPVIVWTHICDQLFLGKLFDTRQIYSWRFKSAAWLAVSHWYPFHFSPHMLWNWSETLVAIFRFSSRRPKVWVYPSWLTFVPSLNQAPSQSSLLSLHVNSALSLMTALTSVKPQMKWTPESDVTENRWAPSLF